ncbi:MAG: hypothetical protein HY901_21780, partial [Deltaproteobacteria bacterium]|nr:hypothetical protein [Deltaproteobacteria bacterium]
RSRPRHRSLTFLRPLRSVRRRLASTRTWMWIVRYRTEVQAALVASILALVGVGLLFHHWWQTEAAFRDRVARADQHLAAGRLAGPGGDTALDLLLAARSLRPGDVRAELRLRTLADTFVDLAGLAEKRDSPAEAAVYLQGAVRADPSRESLHQRLRQLESQVRAQARGEP